MPRKDILDAIRKYTDPFRVTKGKDFRLATARAELEAEK
jgi:hypothetical protein